MLSCLSDLKRLSLLELTQLAKKIRQRMIEVLSTNGGHLSSNLGIVEITIALHRVFDSPRDKLIFDVSHQSYPHKLLTGRNKRFERLRKYLGICGFCHPKESKHDHFFAGHAGTALSLSLGVAKTRDLEKGSEHIIPILGDASLTCGLTLEALNNVPHRLNRFIVVVNDNEMSISENVGNMKQLLTQTSQRFSFFQAMGLSYVGPIDGHDLGALIEIFEQLKNQDNPILLHIETVKGQGMSIAASHPTLYHGVRPFNSSTGQFLSSPSQRPTFPKIFGKHIVKMADRNPDLLCITPAMLAGSCLDELMQKYPSRCIDVGIAEGHAVTFAGGIAYGRKKKVIVSIYATFLQRALDNLFQDVCLQELPVVFAIDRAFLSGPDGSTHHGIYDIAFLNTMPHMIISQPRNGHLLKELLESSLSWDSPGAIRYPNLETEEPISPLVEREIGRGEILSQGKDLLIIALGHMCATALEVKRALLLHGIEPTIVDPIFLKPLDCELLDKMISSHSKIVTIEEHSLKGGLGFIISDFLMQRRVKHVDFLALGIPDRWVQFGSNTELMRELGLDAESITHRILEEFYSRDDRPISQRAEKAIF